jgi:hypothetical protein
VRQQEGRQGVDRPSVEKELDGAPGGRLGGRLAGRGGEARLVAGDDLGDLAEAPGEGLPVEPQRDRVDRGKPGGHARRRALGEVHVDPRRRGSATRSSCRAMVAPSSGRSARARASASRTSWFMASLR